MAEVSDASEVKRRNFEQALSELEARVRRLEIAELPLDKALGLFEEGIELARECHEQLDNEAALSLASNRSADGPNSQG